MNSAASRIETGRKSSAGVSGWPVTIRIAKSGTRARTRFTTPEITVASGKTALGTGSFWRSWALPRRLFIEATMLWLKKFQNRMPARA